MTNYEKAVRAVLEKARRLRRQERLVAVLEARPQGLHSSDLRVLDARQKDLRAATDFLLEEEKKMAAEQRNYRRVEKKVFARMRDKRLEKKDESQVDD